MAGEIILYWLPSPLVWVEEGQSDVLGPLLWLTRRTDRRKGTMEEKPVRRPWRGSRQEAGEGGLLREVWDGECAR